MRIYEVTLSGRMIPAFNYDKATVQVKIKANYMLEACYLAQAEFEKKMIGVKIVKCKEIVV
jgi:hypothetical protein